jgi:hypothetical protein
LECLDPGEDDVGGLDYAVNDKSSLVDSNNGGDDGRPGWFLRGSGVDRVVVDAEKKCRLEWILIQKPVAAGSVSTNDACRDSNPCLGL